MKTVVPQIVGKILLGLVLSTLAMVPTARAEAPASQPALAGAPAAAVATYHNPVDVRGADPFVFHEAGVYYLYATHAGDGVRVWTSDDLVHWKRSGYAFRRDEQTWSQHRFWAPEMFKHNGRYYLHFTASPRGPDKLRIVLAVADSPLGPFHELKAPWFDDHVATIDSDVFRDTDGRLYLYAVHLDHPPERKTFQIVVHRLNDDLTVQKDWTLCLFPDKPWEGKPVSEGPFVMKHDGTYFLTYSTFGFGDPRYRVCLATGKSPLGPWDKVGVILKRTAGVSGPGHHCFIDSPDGKEMFIVYHEHSNPRHFNGGRVIAIDRAHFVDGPHPTIKVDGPTLTPQPMPE